MDCIIGLILDFEVITNRSELVDVVSLVHGAIGTTGIFRCWVSLRHDKLVFSSLNIIADHEQNDQSQEGLLMVQHLEIE